MKKIIVLALLLAALCGAHASAEYPTVWNLNCDQGYHATGISADGNGSMIQGRRVVVLCSQVSGPKFQVLTWNL